MRSQGDVTCAKCGGLFWRKAAWQHKCAIIPVPAINTPAINVVSERTPNRRKRADYNAYMKQYLRAYRKRK